MITLGATLPFSALLYDKDPASGGVLVNATSVTLTITLPPDPVTGITSTASGITVGNPPAVTGTYVYSYVTTTLVGRYVGTWLFTMASGQTSSYAEVFEVEPVDPGFIISLASAKKYLNIPSSDTSNDDEIRDWLSAITPMVEDIVGACIPRTVVDMGLGASQMASLQGDMAFFGSGAANSAITVRTTPVISVTSVVSTYTNSGRTYATAELVVINDRGQITLKNGWPFIGGPWTATYLAGRTRIGPNITQAVKIILGHLWQTQRGAGSPAYLGGDDLVVAPGAGFSIPNRAQDLLNADDNGPGVG
jgi:hypothetical protein